MVVPLGDAEAVAAELVLLEELWLDAPALLEELLLEPVVVPEELAPADDFVLLEELLPPEEETLPGELVPMDEELALEELVLLPAEPVVGVLGPLEDPESWVLPPQAEIERHETAIAVHKRFVVGRINSFRSDGRSSYAPVVIDARHDEQSVCRYPHLAFPV
jgi:hypothetical protein